MQYGIGFKMKTKELLMIGGIIASFYIFYRYAPKGQQAQDPGMSAGGGAIVPPSTNIFYVPQTNPSMQQGSTTAAAQPQMISGYPPGYTPTPTEIMINQTIEPGQGYVSFKNVGGEWQGTSVFTPTKTAAVSGTNSQPKTAAPSGGTLKVPGLTDWRTFGK